MTQPSEFAYLYHAHHTLHGEDLPFWLELATRQRGPILELGCGTGRVLIPLAQLGFRVVGLDNDAGMLALLSAKLEPGSTNPPWLIQADLAAFCLAEKFALILLPCNTFSTLPTEMRKAALDQVAAHLAKGGLFAFSLPNPRLLRRLPAHSEPEVEEVFLHPLDGEPIQVSSAWERDGERFTLYWHYDHLLPDGHVKRISTATRHNLAAFEIYRQDLQAAGLAVSELYGDFDRSPYSPASPSLIIVASH